MQNNEALQPAPTVNHKLPSETPHSIPFDAETPPDISMNNEDTQDGAPTPDIAVGNETKQLPITVQENVGEGLDQTARESYKQNVKRASKWVAGLALAGALAHGTNATEGFYDMAKDASTDAGTVVEQMFPTEDPAKKAAVERVAHTMQDLDDGNIDAIAQRAEEYKQSHRDQLLSPEDAEKINTRIDSAKTNEEVAVVLNDFTQGYGKTVRLKNGTGDSFIGDFDPATPPNMMKNYAHGMVDALGSVPKDYIEDASFSGFEMGGRANEYAGIYDPVKGTVSLVVDKASTLDPKSQQRKASRITSHEIAHADDDLFHKEKAKTSEDISVTHALGELITKGSTILDGYLDQPKDVSSYAHDSEDRREDFAEAESYSRAAGNENRLAHPDQARLFESQANQKLLESAIEFDTKNPGYIDVMAMRGDIAAKKSTSYDRFMPDSPLKYWSER